MLRVERALASVAAAVLVAVMAVVMTATPAAGDATTFTVTKTADTNDGTCDADCSLREAIGAANANPGADTITFSPGLTGTIGIFALGDLLTIDDALTIDGSGAAIILDGGGIRALDATASLTVQDVTIQSGQAGSGDGGGIRSTENVTLIDSTVTDNRAAGNGGGVFTTGTVTATDSTVTNNTSGNGGGAVTASNGVTVTGGTISDNTAAYGGGIVSGNDISITGAVVTGNHATADGALGGGVAAPLGSVTATNSTFTGNTSAGDGGAIFAANDVTVTDGEISHNTAGTPTTGGQGGGIESGSGSATVSDVLMSNVLMIDNHATGSEHASGGAIATDADWGSGSVKVTNGSRIEDNTAERTGGCAGNNSCGPGGIAALVDVTISDSTLSDNTGDGAGAVRMNGTHGSITVTNSTISGNQSTGTCGTCGGGGILAPVATISGSTFADNTSATSGGAIGIGGGGPGPFGASITSSTIRHNTAAGNGGGVFAVPGDPTAVVDLTITGSVIGGPAPSDGNVSGAMGGGVLASTLTLTSSTVRNNTAAQGAGGVGAEATAVVSGSTISDNTATGDGSFGGGIWVSGSLTLTSSTLNANTSTGPGGGALIDCCTAVFGSPVSVHSAGGAGAGPAQVLPGGSTIQNATVSGNTAGSDGGGIWVSSSGASPLALENSTVAFNTAVNGANLHTEDGAQVTMSATILAEPIGPNCDGAITDGDHNLTFATTAGSCAFDAGHDITGRDPLLAPLALNAPGATETHALAGTSPAINEVPASQCPATDQRGVPVPTGARCDIGAYQTLTPVPSDSTTTTTTTPGVTDTSNSSTTTPTTSSPSTATTTQSINSAGGTLPFTGVSPADMLGAAALAALGIALQLAARRRRRPTIS